MKNEIISNIYNEFIALTKLLSLYNPKIVENEALLQLEFTGLDSLEILKELNDLKYFDVYIDNDSPQNIIEMIQSPIMDFKIINVKDLNCRINYLKDLSNDYVKNLECYFFRQEEALEFLRNNSFPITNSKINFGIYNVPSFETPVFCFIDILNEVDYNPRKLINSNDLIMIERLISNTEKKFSKHNNLFSYKCDTLENMNDFKINIIREFYKAFFKLLSYKEINGEYDIRGKKNIIISMDNNFSINNFNDFLNLTEFLFNDDKFLEKYIIVKNVFTRYVYDKETFSTLDRKITEINKTTRYYFEKYVQEDLEIFFKNRDTIFKEAINVSKSINEQNDKINSYINVSLISFLILIISFVFKGVFELNIAHLIIANVAFIVFSLTFYYYISSSSEERFITIEKQFLLFLDKMGIILEEEKAELIENYLTQPNIDLKNSLHRIGYLLFFSNIALLTITLTTIIFNY